MKTGFWATDSFGSAVLQTLDMVWSSLQAVAARKAKRKFQVIIACGIYENMNKWHYLLVTGGLAAPLCLQPFFLPSLTGGAAQSSIGEIQCFHAFAMSDQQQVRKTYHCWSGTAQRQTCGSQSTPFWAPQHPFSVCKRPKTYIGPGIKETIGARITSTVC